MNMKLSYPVYMTPKWIFVPRWKSRSGTRTGVNSRRYDSRRNDILCWYHVNEYRAIRGNRSELAPGWKSPRYHVIRPLLDSLDLKALTTFVVDNMFAEMRQGNEMPVVSQFAHRFSSANKRVSQAPYLAYYEMQLHILHQSVFILYQTSWFHVVWSISLHAKACQKCLSNKTTAGLNENVEGRVWA